MNTERPLPIDLRKWAKRIQQDRNEENDFHTFDMFVLTVFRLILLFFGVDISDKEETLHAKSKLFSHKKKEIFDKENESVILFSEMQNVLFCRYCRS